MKPDHSAKMLRIFLYARAFYKHCDEQIPLVRARNELCEELAVLCGISAGKLKLAHAGKCADAELRAKIWNCLLGGEICQVQS